MWYFFHLRESQNLIVDEEGRELACPEAVEAAAVADARSIIAEMAMSGSISLALVIEVDDDIGNRVLDLPFGDAVTFEG